MTIVTQNEPIRRGKYKAVPTVVDGIRFASKKEARRYSELRILADAGKIEGFVYLKHMLRWPLSIKGQTICTYEADFSYTENGIRIVEDVKGLKTAIYRLKKKLMKALYGIEIRES